MLYLRNPVLFPPLSTAMHNDGGDNDSGKHQGLKKLTKREVLERSHADLTAARRAEEAARHELARRAAAVELRKRYAFVEAVVGAAHAHLVFFRSGADALGRLEAPISDALQIGEHLRAREAARMVRALISLSCCSLGHMSFSHQPTVCQGSNQLPDE